MEFKAGDIVEVEGIFGLCMVEEVMKDERKLNLASYRVPHYFCASFDLVTERWSKKEF